MINKYYVTITKEDIDDYEKKRFSRNKCQILSPLRTAVMRHFKVNFHTPIHLSKSAYKRLDKLDKYEPGRYLIWFDDTKEVFNY